MNKSDEIKNIINNAKAIAEDTLKRKDKPIIGYFCSYIPEEIIHAAGAMPYRMNALNSTGTTQGDIYYSHLNCTFARHCFDKAMQGIFSFLDGVVFMNACDHLRRMYDNWCDASIHPEFRHMFFVPHVINPVSIKYFTEELQKLSHAIASYFQCQMTTQQLNDAILLYQDKRNLLQKIYHIRLNHPGIISASDMLSIMLTITIIPVQDAIDILHQVIDHLKESLTHLSNQQFRVFFASSCIEDIDHIKIIESCGLDIVSDNHCLGYHYFDNTISAQSDDPFNALAERYLTRVSCPRMMNDFQKRWALFLNQWINGLVDGLIIERLKFCDLWGSEIFMFRQECQHLNIPILWIERELYANDSGQVKTRVQAFVEHIENAKANK